jgi:hypothetical protein
MGQGLGWDGSTLCASVDLVPRLAQDRTRDKPTLNARNLPLIDNY